MQQTSHRRTHRTGADRAFTLVELPTIIGKWHGSDSEPFYAYMMRRYNVLYADGHVRNIRHGELGDPWVFERVNR